MKYPKVFLLVITLLCPGIITAQQDSVEVEVVVLETETTNKDIEEQQTSYTEDRNYVYFNTYLLARGAFVMGYERMLNKAHAVNVEFGLTYRDFVYESFGDEEFIDVNTSTGQFVSLNYKIYPNKNLHYDGEFYISPGFIYRNYNLVELVGYRNGSEFIEEEVDAGYSMTDLSLKLGYVYESRWFSNLIVDAYAGFGLRSLETNDHELVENNNNTVLQRENNTTSVATAYLGAKIGFVF